MVNKPIKLHEKLSSFPEHWSPKIVANYNGNDVMVVKLKGEFLGTIDVAFKTVS